MTSFKLTDIDGVPKKIGVDTYLPGTTEEKCVYNYGFQEGFNEAIDQLSQVELEADIEKMAIIMYHSNYYAQTPSSKIRSNYNPTWEMASSATKVRYRKNCMAISTQLPRLLTVVKP